MLGDLDVLLARVEALPALVTTAEERLTSTVTALDNAGDKYRMAITVFTEQAKTELTEYLDRKTIEVSSKIVEEQRAAIQEAARVAFRSEALDKTVNLGLVLGEAVKEFRRSMRLRLMEYAITVLISSGFTVGLLYALGKIH